MFKLFVTRKFLFCETKFQNKSSVFIRSIYMYLKSSLKIKAPKSCTDLQIKSTLQREIKLNNGSF